MSETIEKLNVVQDLPIGPVVERSVVGTRIDSVASARRGMSVVAVAALVVAAIAVTVVITMLIMNSQQKTSDDQLVQERARIAAAQQQASAQPTAQQPLSLPAPAARPAKVVARRLMTPVRPPPSYMDNAPSNAAIEIDVTSLLQNDPKLRTYAIDVKVTEGTALLSGNVSAEALKTRAGKLAGTVRGVKKVINDIAVRP